IEALIEAVSVFNIAAEVAAENENCGGPGTFSPLLLDTLYHLNETTYQQRIRIQEVE
ncbi:hydroxyethylthiazole kinase, partial [Staphylococcus aureus]|nr:hydroxyethylthiazole kinase [Staphylococcus aureus]